MAQATLTDQDIRTAFPWYEFGQDDITLDLIRNEYEFLGGTTKLRGDALLQKAFEEVTQDDDYDYDEGGYDY